MRKILYTGLSLSIGLLFVAASATAQHREDSIEESWDRAAREKVQREQQQENYRWQTEQMQEQTQPAQPVAQPASRWPHLPANPTSHDYYTANTALIDSLSHMYCVSTSYLRTLTNRNEAVKPTAAPAQPTPEPAASEDSKFGYEKESWGKDQPKEEPAPPPVPDRSTQELKTLNQELYQLLDKCLNK